MPSPTLVLRFFVAVCLIWLPLQSFDLWLYDQLFRLKPRSQSPTSIVLVTLSPGKLQQHLSNSEASIDTWYSDLYDSFLKQLSLQKPKLIIFTQRYKEVDPPPFRVRTQTPLLFSSSIDFEGKVLPPFNLSDPKLGFGFNNLFLDSDNVFRASPLIFSSEKSLGVMAFESLNKAPYSTDLTKSSRIYFNGPPNSFPKIDLFDALRSDNDPAFFENKIVLVGKESGPLSDVDTPMGKMSIAEVHANIINTLNNQLSVTFLSSHLKHLVTLLSFSLTLFLIFFFPLSIGSALLFLWSILLTLIGFSALIWFQVWIGLASPLFIVLSTHLLFIGYKIQQQEEKQRRIQEESRLLKEIDQFKNNFISLFSHDLKTPIAKIKAVIDRMINEHPHLQNSIAQGLQTIEKANEELSRLISDILRVTKMESMVIEPSKEVIDLNRLVGNAVQRLTVLADEKQLQIIQNLEPLFAMEGDPHLLLEVITNLLENAVKYSPPHSRIIIQTRESENRVSVHIFDEGPGIPEDELPRVTTKFYRGKDASNATKGTGLGLYLAKYFVELHRGTLELQSKVGVGTHVSFSLPIK